MLTEFLQARDLSSLIKPFSERLPFPREKEGWLKIEPAIREKLLRDGDEAVKNGYPMRTATGFLAYVRFANRMMDQHPYFQRRERLISALLAACLTREGKYVDAVIDGIWCACEETGWNICAHNGAVYHADYVSNENALPDAECPTIDLFAAQTAATLSYAVYFLENELNAVSPLIVRRVRNEVERRVLAPFMERDDFWWMGSVRKNLNNWTPWILSNVIDSFALLERDDEGLAFAIKRIAMILDRYLVSLSPDGGCDEGCAYWNVAGASLLDCLESLRVLTGGEMDFYREPLIREIGAFPLRAHIDGDWFLNFADCDAKPVLSGERVYTYGARTGNAALKAFGAGLIAREKNLSACDTPQLNRILHRLFVTLDGNAAQPEAPERVALPDVQVFAFRRGDLYAAIKGGHNGERHNHNDVGVFVVYRGGQPYVVDVGNIEYTAKTFSKDRYTLWNTRSMNHNIPLIGGVEQRVGSEYRAKLVSCGEDHVAFDLSLAYPEEAQIERYTRQMTVKDGVLMADNIALSSPRGVEWVFMLCHDPVKKAPGALEFGGMTLTYDDDLAVHIEKLVVTDWRIKANFPGGLWRLTLTAPEKLSHDRVFRFG